MDPIPEFWRTEIWHPLSVHFPIALLLFATFSFFTSLFIKDSIKARWRFMTKALLTVGVIAAWIALFTGDLADGAVSRKICDPTILKDHEIGAYTSSIIFSIALLLLLIKDFPLMLKVSKFFSWLVLILLIVGSGYLAYAGHLGATLVYQQGAGVYHPSEDCWEFE